jgi:Putative zinc-finger
MKCPEFEALLSGYLEQELSPEAVREMDKHLGICDSCSTLLQDATELRSSLNDFPWVEPGESLIECILERTSGKIRSKNKIWGSIMVWFNPVLTQRHVFATLMVLVFFSFATNLLGPEFTASGQSGMNPAVWGERVTSVSGDLYKKWRAFDSFKHRVGDEISLLKDDLLGRLDYHLTMALFKSYEESIQDKEDGSAETVKNETSKD